MATPSVFCVCGGIGFPYGTASTRRVTLIGRALSESGLPFHVLHIGPSPFSANTLRSGQVEGISYDYLGPRVRWSDNRVGRSLCYILGGVSLLIRLLQRRRFGVVYCYYQGNVMNLWVFLICRALKIPVIQEASEWWPGTEYETLISRVLYRRIMFRLSAASLPISRAIALRIERLRKPGHRTFSIPVLVDPDDTVHKRETEPIRHAAPVLLWCGMVDGYRRDVLFLVDALAALTSPEGQAAALVVVGPCSEPMRQTLKDHAHMNGIDPDRVMVRGYVSEGELRGWCVSAQALLMPLWDDDRSRTRFPTKLGQYLAARRPVVTAPVGDVTGILPDDAAYYYQPGSVRSLAGVLDRCLSDPKDAESRVRRATRIGLPRLDYRLYGPDLRSLIEEVCR
ncbi:hypothetical protein JCM14469_14320 [Desulfatiferula olefinivorans]